VIKPLPVLLCLLLKTTAFGADPAITRAVERSILLIEKSVATYVKARDCFTCHHQALPLMALSNAKRAGFKIDDQVIQAQTKFTLEYFADRQDRLPKGQGVVGGPYTAGYALAGLHAAQADASATAKALVAYLLKTQQPDGSWRIRTHRPPLEDSHFTATALALDGLLGGSDEEVGAAWHRGIQWLQKANPKSTEDRVFQILGLGIDSKTALETARKLLATQQKDGGFAQLPGMQSDAYATGQAIMALRAANEHKQFAPAIERAKKWLVANQKPDGSWHVKSRSRPIQKYFESGFPHGKDQFISISATCWAVLALTGNK
jgi:squalene cyclase